MMGAQHEHARRKRQHRSTVFRHNKQDTATLVLLWNGCFTSRVQQGAREQCLSSSGILLCLLCVQPLMNQISIASLWTGGGRGWETSKKELVDCQVVEHYWSIAQPALHRTSLGAYSPASAVSTLLWCRYSISGAGTISREMLPPFPIFFYPLYIPTWHKVVFLMKSDRSFILY